MNGFTSPYWLTPVDTTNKLTRALTTARVHSSPFSIAGRISSLIYLPTNTALSGLSATDTDFL